MQTPGATPTITYVTFCQPYASIPTNNRLLGDTETEWDDNEADGLTPPESGGAHQRGGRLLTDAAGVAGAYCNTWTDPDEAEWCNVSPTSSCNREGPCTDAVESRSASLLEGIVSLNRVLFSATALGFALLACGPLSLWLFSIAHERRALDDPWEPQEQAGLYDSGNFDSYTSSHATKFANNNFDSSYGAYPQE